VRFWPRGGFQLDDGRLTVRETTTHSYAFHAQTGHRVVSLDARIDGGTVRGTVTAAEQFNGPYWGAYECRSGPVTFSARAG
jgi:hypothetical protein